MVNAVRCAEVRAQPRDLPRLTADRSCVLIATSRKYLQGIKFRSPQPYCGLFVFCSYAERMARRPLFLLRPEFPFFIDGKNPATNGTQFLLLSGRPHLAGGV
jgi:hypothetical protein